MTANYSVRIARAQEALRAQRLAAAVFAPTDQMRYLTGWAEPGHERLIALLVPAEGDPAFVVPAINAEQARRNPADIADVRPWEDASGWHGVVRDLLEEWRIAGGSLAIDDELHSVHLLGIQGLLGSVECVPAGDLMARLREIKDAGELTLMARSASVTDAVYEECLSSLREGMTELEMQEAIAEAYRRRGTRPAFAIVCFGANSALPHHRTGSARLKDGDIVVMDIGCTLDDYNSDITRTVAFRIAGPEAKKVYRIVHAAHRAAFEAGRPGVPCEKVDRAARQVIEAAGYGECFIHRTGHGIGLSGHEPPYIVAGNKQPLAEGICFSVEPGIYLPGRFGVRIENIVTVTEDGLRSLNADPPAELPVIET
jgi:Xaa-Pro aminopeptidase